LFVAFHAIVVFASSTADAFTGTKWRALPEAARAAYVAGVVDTWENVNLLTQAEKKKDPRYKPTDVEVLFSPTTTCAHDEITYVQAIAIVDKYMSQNPEEWHQPMAILVWSAFAKSCLAGKR